MHRLLKSRHPGIHNYFFIDLLSIHDIGLMIFNKLYGLGQMVTLLSLLRWKEASYIREYSTKEWSVKMFPIGKNSDVNLIINILMYTQATSGPCISGGLCQADSIVAYTCHNSTHCLLVGSQSTQDARTISVNNKNSHKMMAVRMWN